MAEVKWIKLMTNIFDNRKIKQIEKLPDGDSIILIWVKMICLAGEINENGRLSLTNEIPYTEEQLAIQFDKPIAVIKCALSVFEQFGMIEVVDNFIYLSNWERYQNTQELEHIRQQTRARVQNYRERQKAIASPKCNVTVTLPVTLGNATDKEEDIDKEKKESVREKESVTPTPTLREIFVKKYDISVDIPVSDDSFDFNELLKAYSQSKFLQANLKLMSAIEKQYSKIVNGYYTDFKKVDKVKPQQILTRSGTEEQRREMLHSIDNLDVKIANREYGEFDKNTKAMFESIDSFKVK